MISRDSVRGLTKEGSLTKRTIIFLALAVLLHCVVALSAAEGEEAPSPPSLQLNPAEITLKKGTSAACKPTVADAPKGVKATKYEWSSSAPEVAAYQNGLVRGYAGGSAVLTCTATLTDGTQLSAVCAVSVTVPVRELRADSKAITVMAGEPVVPEYQVYPEDATSPAVRFVSSDEQVLLVDGDGGITAVAEGKATLTAELEENPQITLRWTVTVTRRVGKADMELTFQGIPWGSDCDTCVAILKAKGFIAEETRSRWTFTSMAWHWPENDLLFSRSSSWRMLPVSFSDRQMGAGRMSLNPMMTIGGYLPQVSVLIFFNGLDEEGRVDPDATRLIGVYFEFDSRHEKGSIIFRELLARLENQYGAFKRYLQRDIPRYYPDLYSQIEDMMAGATEYAIQEPELDGYLGESAICTIYGDARTGIMLSLDTGETVSLFYGRTDAEEMLQVLREALREEAPEMEDAGV